MIVVSVLGATGSIGKSTLQVLAKNADHYQIFALAANTNVVEMVQLCRQYKPRFAALYDEKSATLLQRELADEPIQVLSGQSGLEFIATHPDVNAVMCGIVGAAGLLSTIAAARAGKRVLLANKESLVLTGELLLAEIEKHQAQLLPVDSEHNAVLQCLPNDFVIGKAHPAVKHVVITASGGPFRKLPIEKLHDVTPDEACAHPTWKMGRKISVDSATLMNKALEVIEAHWLFALPIEKIEVLLHPQSIMHALVEYHDGSLLAHLGVHDMKIPISAALAWPKRIDSGANRLNLAAVRQLEFAEVDRARYPALELGYLALKLGGTASTILNAANEVLVAAFLEQKILFTDIVKGCETVLESLPVENANDLDSVLEADRVSRVRAHELIRKLTAKQISFAF